MYPHDSSLLSDITPNRQPSTANSAKSKAQRSSLCKCLSAHPGSGIKREEICVLCTYTHNHCKYKYIHTSVSITCVNVYIVKKTSIYLTVYIYIWYSLYILTFSKASRSNRKNKMVIKSLTCLTSLPFLLKLCKC